MGLAELVLVPLVTKDWLQPLATVLGPVIAVGGVIYGVRVQKRAARAAEESAETAKQAVGANLQIAEGVAQRAAADALAKRYQDAAGQLGHDQATVRLAGAYAMAQLADDWPSSQQACIDVLCSYLRMPSQSEDSRNDQTVRTAIVEIIGEHLAHGENSWSKRKIKLSGADLPRIDWPESVFVGHFEMNGGRMIGTFRFDRAQINSHIQLFNRIFGSTVAIRVKALNHIADFRKSTFIGNSDISLENVASSGAVYLDQVQVKGRLTIHMSDNVSAGLLHIEELVVHPGGLFEIKGPITGETSTEGIRIAEGSNVRVHGRGQIDAPGAHFLGKDERERSIYAWGQ